VVYRASVILLKTTLRDIIQYNILHVARMDEISYDSDDCVWYARSVNESSYEFKFLDVITLSWYGT